MRERTFTGQMNLERLYLRLLEMFEVEGWWPSESSFEVMVGAILTQQTSWDSVERALTELRSRGLLEPNVLAEADIEFIEEVIRPCGFYHQKARRIRGLAHHIQQNHGGVADRILENDTATARSELLSLNGVGKETADSILLFAGRRPKFVAASYVSRVLRRTGILNGDGYDKVQEFVESGFTDDPEELAKLYALFVQLAKTYCRSKPNCESCPISDECDTGLAHGMK